MLADNAFADRHLTGEEILDETRKQAVKAWGKILPFGAQVVASAAAYSVGITATQVSQLLGPAAVGAIWQNQGPSDPTAFKLSDQ
jgi:hypothetical protein